VDIPLGYGQSGRPPVLVIVSGYSRMITARMLPSRTSADLIDGHWRLLTGWQAVPKTLVWDNEAGVGKGRPATEFAAFAGLLATRIHFCRPRDPEAKGLVERANGYLETSFLPGRAFTGPGDFNTQLAAWLQIANRRRHRGIGCRPVDRWEADRSAMLAIPPVDPPRWWPLHTRIGRDHYIRLDTNDYSVHPRAIGHTVTVQADTEQITVTTASGDVVAHHVRCWAKHQSITDPDHATAAASLREDAWQQRAARAQAAHLALAPDDLGVDVEQRELTTYDRVFTLIEGGAGKEDT
jgi:transposase